MKTNEMLLIGGIALVAGLFIFKDHFEGICTKIPIPFLCPSAEVRAEMLTKFGDPDVLTPGDEEEQAAMYAGYY